MNEDEELGTIDYDDFMSDTAECQFCGHYYCLCCGCDCWSWDEEGE